MSEYFLKPYKPLGGNVKVELDLSNYAAKANLKGGEGVDTSNLAAKLHLASLKAEVDKINLDQLIIIPAHLSKLSNLVDSGVAKKIVYEKGLTLFILLDLL